MVRIFKTKSIQVLTVALLAVILSYVGYSSWVAKQQVEDGIKLGEEILSCRGQQTALMFKCERKSFYLYEGAPVNVRTEFIVGVDDGRAYIAAARKRLAALRPDHSYRSMSHVKLWPTLVGKRREIDPINAFPSEMDAIPEGQDLVYIRIEGTVEGSFLD